MNGNGLVSAQVTERIKAIANTGHTCYIALSCIPCDDSRGTALQVEAYKLSLTFEKRAGGGEDLGRGGRHVFYEPCVLIGASVTSLAT